ncbi:MAG: hypothetical protein ACUVTL_00475 [Thermoproteota archaeon]
MVCSNCGLVQQTSEILEVPSIAVMDDLHYVGYNPGFVCGLGSEIPMVKGVFRDGRGRSILPHHEIIYLRLRKASSEIRSRLGSSELRTARLMWQVSELLHLPKPVTESAILMYRRSMPRIQGSCVRHAALAACCLIYTAREFSNITTLSMKEALKAFARKGVKLKARDILKAGFLIKSDLIICRSEDYLYRILDRLVSLLDKRTIMKCGFEDRFKLLQKLYSISKNLLSNIGPEVRRGRNPLLLASAVVYASTRLLSPFTIKSPISQRIVALASGTVEYSLRETYESLKGVLP